MEMELIADYACATGEGPLWHPMEKRLYWTDIPSGRMFRYDPASGAHEQFYNGDVVGGYTIQSDGALLLFGSEGSVRLWRDGELTSLVGWIPAEEKNRFNDVIVDPEGRVFCGTMADGKGKGKLYRFDLDGTLTALLDGIGCSNGMGFTPDLKRMYYTDSVVREIYLFDYDRATGVITNQRVFATTEKKDGVPDGMTVDSEGCVWSARWGGACVARYDPAGKEMTRIELPVPKVSCVTFGGDDYSEMYITTAGGKAKDQDGPAAGALFRCRPGVKGVPEFLSRIGE